MKVQCILKTWYKHKKEDDRMFYEVPSYDIKYYENNKEFDTKHAIQIICINEEEIVLAEKIFIPDGKTTHYLNFCNASFCYMEDKKTIYNTSNYEEI